VDTRKSTKDAWTKVREVIRGSNNQASDRVDGLTPQMFNDHYAAISTDNNYRAPRPKLSASSEMCCILEEDVFRLLDTARPTATGLDSIPAWFLRVGAPIFSAPLARLFNQSLLEGVVPRQWKTAVITPIAKIPKPTQPSDFRPISVTPVLSRILERFIVKKYIYPALLQPHSPLDFSDQFAFRPSGSTTAAIVGLLHTVRAMLSENDYVHVFSFDYSKAFDTVRHATLMSKLAQLAIPDNIYNWIRNFYQDRSHSTKYDGLVSTVAGILASVIQGSALGPASYIVTAADLHPVHAGNQIFKFADDTYLVVPAINSGTCNAEIEHMQTWAASNNLKMNHAKTMEIVFTARRTQAPSPPCKDIERVSSLRVLGVIINDKLTAADHVSTLLTSCSSLFYALRVLRTHGIPAQSLHDVFRATVVAKILYCAPAWSGMCSAADRARLNSLLRRAKRLNYCTDDLPPIAELFSNADDDFFHRINTNSNHVLQPYLPDNNKLPYQLRTRHHNKSLIIKTNFLNDTDFIVRMLYKYSY